jgi:lipid II:glycine glycyltransferase (peptidoglycan interpeptide bridge formation enzyme)
MNLRVSQVEDDAEAVASFLQSDFWGEFKAEHGWRPFRLWVEAFASRAQILVLVRHLPAGFCFAYIPHGPEMEIAAENRTLFLAELSEALRPFVPRGCLFIRYDPPWYAIEEIDGDHEDAVHSLDVEDMRPLIGRPLRRAAADVQPPDTVLIDLRPSEEDILAAMKSKWRYNVRLAEKKGVVVHEAGIEAVPEFYKLYRATSVRDKIALHPESYYSRMFSLASDRSAAGFPGTPDIRLWIARHEGQALAAIVTLFRADRAVYLYGASSDEKRNLMPAYALQWAAMRAAKAAGCAQYDLFGIPPTDDAEHPMSGLYRFKTGFGGEIAHRAGSWDYPLRALAYALFRAAERSRSWWFKDYKKRLKRSKRTRA